MNTVTEINPSQYPAVAASQYVREPTQTKMPTVAETYEVGLFDVGSSTSTQVYLAHLCTGYGCNGTEVTDDILPVMGRECSRLQAGGESPTQADGAGSPHTPG